MRSRPEPKVCPTVKSSSYRSLIPMNSYPLSPIGRLASRFPLSDPPPRPNIRWSPTLSARQRGFHGECALLGNSEEKANINLKENRHVQGPYHRCQSWDWT